MVAHRLRYLSGGKLDFIAVNAFSINAYAYTSSFVECITKLLELHIKCSINAEHHVQRDNEFDECPDRFDEHSRGFDKYPNDYNNCPNNSDNFLNEFNEPFARNCK